PEPPALHSFPTRRSSDLTVEVQGRSAWVNAADRRLQLRCAVAPPDLHDARHGDWVIARITRHAGSATPAQAVIGKRLDPDRPVRSEEHTSELQSPDHLVC